MVGWEQATKSGEINEYCRLVKQQLSGLNFHACLDGIADIEAYLPPLTHSKMLKLNCYLKSATRNSYMERCTFHHPVPKAKLPGKPGRRMDVWKDHFMMKKVHWELKKRLRYCAAQAESRRLLCRDKMIASSYLHRFKLSGQRKKNLLLTQIWWYCHHQLIMSPECMGKSLFKSSPIWSHW